MADNLHLVSQALTLPTGLIRQATPSVTWQQRVYAYQLQIIVSQIGELRVDARQLPVNIAALQGQYGELGLYATSVTDLQRVKQPTGVRSARYLGEQLSLVFFPELLTRYRELQKQNDLPDELYPEEDGIPAFQDAYADRLAAYTPQGFLLGDYERAPMLRFGWGTVLVSAAVQEQIERVAQPGDWVDIAISEYSLACFKARQFPN
jgi:hypothetical protein